MKKKKLRTPTDEPDTPIFETSIELVPHSSYGRLSEKELIMRDIEFDNHYERFDLDEPEDFKPSNRKAD